MAQVSACSWPRWRLRLLFPAPLLIREQVAYLPSTFRVPELVRDSRRVLLSRGTSNRLLKAAASFDAILSRRVFQGRYVTHVELEKPESGGLGFSVVGLKSENHGELGIFIQEIQPGSVAHR